jgi:YfiR/HmsC-like
MRHRIPNLKQRTENADGGGSPWNFWLWIRRFHPALVPAFFFLTFSNPSAEAQVSREYELKAVFLYNFTQFTDWPESAFAETNTPVTIGILGTDPFGRALEDTVKGETVRGHPLRIEHYRHAEEIKTCHILFISQSEARHTNEIVKSLKGKPVLTVADGDGPSTTEAVIRFVVESNKVHFRINLESANAANLVLSSKLLRVAESPPPGKAP